MLLLLIALRAALRTIGLFWGLLIISLVVLPFYGEQLGMPWAQSFIRVNFWEIIKLVLGITFILLLVLFPLTTFLSRKIHNTLQETSKINNISILSKFEK